MDRTASMKLKNTSVCASIIDYELVIIIYLLWIVVMSSAGLGSGKQFDNCSSSYQSSSLRSDVLVVCEVMSWYLTRVHLTAAS